MTTHDENLAVQAERGELAVKPGGINLRGDAAAAEGRRLLMEATGASSIEDVVRIALGRPRLGATAGPSPVVRARVPQALKDRVTEIAERENRNESDIVRDALVAYVEHRAAS